MRPVDCAVYVHQDFKSTACPREASAFSSFSIGVCSSQCLLGSAVVVMAMGGFALLGSWPYLALSEEEGPDYWAVQGVFHDDHLNLRKGPSVKFSVVAQIPSGFSYLE